MHPASITVLNSPDDLIVKRAVADLEYHCRFLDSLGLDGEHKIILHLGGVYGNRSSAMNGFIHNFIYFLQMCVEGWF
jgi:UV DNA damage endonuclease